MPLSSPHSRPAHTPGHELLSIQIDRREHATVVRPCGELDRLTALLVNQVLDHHLDHHQRITLDLTGVCFVSSDGLRALERAQRRARQRAAPFEAVAPADHFVRRLASSTGSELRIAQIGQQPGALPEPRVGG